MSLLRRLLFAWLIMLPALHAQEGGDMQAQILYAFHTEDGNALARLVQGLATRLKDDAGDKALRYHLAHARYRYGLLLAATHAKGADASLSDCIDDLKPLLEQDDRSAEGYILQAACYGSLAQQRSMQGPLLRSRAADRLATAGRLAPRNPRYLLVRAEQDLVRAKSGSSERQLAFTELQVAAARFDESSSTNIDEPGWGHAQAYLLLGTELKSRGDRVQARNLIEKALLVAPDYRAAQRELGRP